MAAVKGCRPGQLALAWLLAQPSDFVPIPGTKRVKYVQENITAASVAVNADEIAYLGEVFAPQPHRRRAVHRAHANTVASSTT